MSAIITILSLIQFVFLYVFLIRSYILAYTYVAICEEFNYVEINWSDT